ncbi:hypothetical protein B0H19DRAFT_1307662 [Mycena capillaripes]|nr:hypothetical protein B0H19DRAFT_1307662 [Mycena capillaripes]
MSLRVPILVGIPRPTSAGMGRPIGKANSSRSTKSYIGHLEIKFTAWIVYACGLWLRVRGGEKCNKYDCAHGNERRVSRARISRRLWRVKLRAGRHWNAAPAAHVPETAGHRTQSTRQPGEKKTAVETQAADMGRIASGGWVDSSTGWGAGEESKGHKMLVGGTLLRTAQSVAGTAVQNAAATEFSHTNGMQWSKGEGIVGVSERSSQKSQGCERYWEGIYARVIGREGGEGEPKWGSPVKREEAKEWDHNNGKYAPFWQARHSRAPFVRGPSSVGARANGVRMGAHANEPQKEESLG